MSRVVVGMGEYAVSNTVGDELVIHSLGSCLGVCVYARDLSIAGVAHFVLPLGRKDDKPDPARPCRYVDSGMHFLFTELVRLGIDILTARIYVAGGASMWDASGLFDIGNRNYVIFRRFLWKNKFLIDGEDVGGGIPRSLHCQIGLKAVSVFSGGQERSFSRAEDAVKESL